MTGMEIPQAAIEAVARQVFFAKRGVQWDFVWADEEKRAKAQQEAIEFAHAGLSAALPHLLAEVKVLTETARQEVADRIASEADLIAERYQETANHHRAISIEHRASAKYSERHFKTALAFKNKADGAWAAAQIARDLSSQAADAVSDATSGVPGHPEVSEAVRSPQEPPKLVCRRCNGYGLLGVAAGVNPVPCPDCALPAREPS